MDILERINQLKAERGWTEYQLAEASEIPQSTISSWYRKNMLPSVGSLEKICKGLGVSMAQFFAENRETTILSEEQQQLLENWNRLSPKQRESLLSFLKNF
ncbi:MAG: helix-turn-helix transcriptional regulator [Clostridia bacterium]